jgi:large subunit ribosomal protein L17
VRHARSGKKLGRDSAHRKALYSNLAGALIEHGRIKTTVTKAKAVKPIAEQMITLGRRGDLHARRQATAFLRSRDVVHKLFADVAPLFKDRPGGYTRIVKIGLRQGDAAEMAYLELVNEEYVAAQREERTPEPVAAAIEEPVDEAQEADAGEAPEAEASEETEGEAEPEVESAGEADESTDDGDGSAADDEVK